MAESSVNVTEGAGKKLHTFNRTIGANSVEDEVVLLGENYLASYIVSPPGVISTATAASHLLQIMAGASLKVRIRYIEIWQYAVATAATNVNIDIIRLTSAGTGGTVVTPLALDTTDSAAGMTAMTLPTAKGTEAAAALIHSRPYMQQTISASTPHINPIAHWDFDRPRSKPLILQAGATIGIAIKCIDAVAGGSVFINVWADESNF